MPFRVVKHLAIAWPGLLLALLLSAPGYCDTDGRTNPVAAETLTTRLPTSSVCASLCGTISRISRRGLRRPNRTRSRRAAQGSGEGGSRSADRQQKLRKCRHRVDASKLRAETTEAFDFQKEIFALLRPAIDEMKEMTACQAEGRPEGEDRLLRRAAADHPAGYRQPRKSGPAGR